MSVLRQIQIPEAFQPLFDPWRFKVFYGGRGSGKSWSFAIAILTLCSVRPLRILCTRQQQNSIKDSVKQLLEDCIERYEFTGWKITEDKLVHENGSSVVFKGLWNNINNLKSFEGVDICWVEEAHDVSERAWDKLIPTIRKAGSEIWVSFNPENRTDNTYERFVVNEPPNAFVKLVSYKDNPWFTAELRTEMNHMKEVDYDKYLHIYEGQFKEYAEGAIYAKQLREVRERGGITKIPVEKGVVVNTAWDLGRNDSTSIWFFQIVGREHRFIDFYEGRLVELDHYAQVLQERGYLYGDHYLPHDVGVTDLSSTRGSRKTILESLGVKPITVVPRVESINIGIEVTRQAFGHCWFDEKRCADGLNALANYQYRFDEQYNVFRPTPVHNWASNPADAFRQYAQGYREARAPRKRIKQAGWG